MQTSTAFLADPPLTPAASACYDEALTEDGYVANYLRIWSWRPDLLTSFAAPRAAVIGESSLSPREVAVMVAATASARGDSYCALAWGENLAELSDEATAAGVVTGADTGLSEREAALATWSRRVVRDPNGTTEADVEQLRQVGFDDREIFEATTWIALRLAFSTINDALGAKPDRELAERVPPLVREAVTFGRATA